MELWIRSQDRGSLIKADNLGLFGNRIVFIPNRPTGGRMTIGRYKTEERALEVLDEIQSKIKQQFLCKPNPTLSCKDIERAENVLNLKYKQDFIMEPPGIDIEPINISTIVYEMPEK